MNAFTELKSANDILQLSYFDFMACMGDWPMHPGGPAATQRVLEMAQVRVGERILEIGCGTGVTTRLLVNAGARLTVIEKSRYMLSAMERAFRRSGAKLPTIVNADVGSCEGLRYAHFDVALCECVIGFVTNQDRFIETLAACLGSNGRIAVVDMHYVDLPSSSLVSRLNQAAGCEIAPMTEGSWNRLFGQFERLSWDTFDLPTVAPPTFEEIKQSLNEAGVFEDCVWIDDAAITMFRQRWCDCDAVFAENRKLLRGHLAVWRA